MPESVIIIGSGLGGLECGYILAKNGLKVTILEKNSQVGGCLQTFRRLGRVFDTGFHYVGGLAEGESLYPLARYFGLLDLPWKQLDPNCSDKVFIGDESFDLATGHENFVRTLSRRFPDQKENLETYVSSLKRVGEDIFTAFKNKDGLNELLSLNAYEFLEKTVSDDLLRKVLSGSSLKMNLDKGTLPLYVFAQINNSFLQSSWRLAGGGSMIAGHLVKDIESMGGTVICDAEVVALNESDGKISEVVLSDGRVMSADWIISDAHPSVTLDLVKQSSKIRRVYRSRIYSQKNSFGMFTANVCLKKGVVKYQNNNVFIHKKDTDLWNPDTLETSSVMVHFYVPEDGSEYADRLDIMTPWDYSAVSQWENLPCSRRGKAYENLKRAKLQECLSLIGDKIEGLQDAVEAAFTSSPLTYSDYTYSPSGSAYGVMKDCTNPLTSLISPKTPVSNLLLTGQSLNLHGVLGVSMTSVLTCACILGMDKLRNQILQE